LNIHYFQHSPSEGLGEIEPWARRRRHSISATRFDLGETPPSLEFVDWLIVMGGAMNVYEHRSHPWLVSEKRFLADALAAGKTVLGICLGAQLIADALGGKVVQNSEIEIGWFPVRFQASLK
jgi:GMP synthase-like glutamine amidotransferase